MELGLRYRWESLRSGGDPSLFLDFRPVRRLLMNQCAGKDVLNLFAYTCGASVAAAAGGARSVCNVDHSSTYLRIGKRNLELNKARWEGKA
jgi:23S rRNA (cytosine1962-C5)-methyltransferase